MPEIGDGPTKHVHDDRRALHRNDKVTWMRGSISLAVLLVLSMGRGQSADPDPAAIAYFEKQVRPLLVEHCHGCHSVKTKKTSGGLALDSREAILTGGDSGPAVVPGKPEKSLLVSAV